MGFSMKTTTPRDIGSLVREARQAALLSQTALGKQIGTSRFWVAEFEQGKAGVELGLVLKAIRALGLVVNIGPQEQVSSKSVYERPHSGGAVTMPPAIDLAAVIAQATTPHNKREQLPARSSATTAKTRKAVKNTHTRKERTPGRTKTRH